MNIIQKKEGEEKEKKQTENDIVYIYALFISVPFLIATYFVYSLLPDLNNLHALTLRGYVGCMAVTNCILAITQLMPVERFSDIFCIIIGIFSQNIHFLIYVVTIYMYAYMYRGICTCAQFH